MCDICRSWSYAISADISHICSNDKRPLKTYSPATIEAMDVEHCAVDVACALAIRVHIIECCLLRKYSDAASSLHMLA